MTSSRFASKKTSRRSLLKTAAALPLLAACSKAGGAKTDEMLSLGARDVVARIAKGEMKAEAYARRLLKQFADHKDLNTVIYIDEARFLAGAKAVDDARARGDKLGTLAGLPLGVKDQADAAGYPTTAGNSAIKGYTAKRSAAPVEACEKAGAVVFAKMNCSAMAGQVPTNGATSSNPYFGFVRNPYDPARIPGGSSGGPGAAIAARIIPAAIGEDSGGSVRIPAACCGIAGLRPSTFTIDDALNGAGRKRYSSDGMVPPAGLVDTFGPFARTVADVAFLDQVITGEQAPAVELKGARIGVPRADYWASEFIQQDVRKTTEAALAKLKDAGVEFVEIDMLGLIALDADGKLNAAIRRNNNAMPFADWLAANAPDVKMEDINRLRDSYGFKPPVPIELSDAEAKDVMTKAAALYQDTFRSSGLIAIAFPTLPILAPLINSNGDTPGQRMLVDGRWISEYDALTFNMRLGPRMGAPGLSLPSGIAQGLPVGLSFQGLPGEDAKILGLGIAAEKVLGSVPPPSFVQNAAT